MARKRLPKVAETGRHYLDRTRGGWLASAPLERHVFARRRALALTVAAALAALLGLALLLRWLT